MHFGFLIIGIITCYIWIYRYTGAIPTVTLSASSSPYFDIGGSISLTCSINEDVGIKNVYLTIDGTPYVLIQINNASICVSNKYLNESSDPHSYSIICEQRMIFHIVMNGTVEGDDNRVWSCQMSAESGICNYPCISTSTVRTALRVPVSSVHLTDGTGQLLVTPVPVLDGSSKVVRCDTSPNGSRPRALFNWYKRSENQSPILIHHLSVSTPSPKPEVDLSMNISYSTLTLMGNRSYQNMYIYCEAQDETNRGNFVKSTEAQINIVYPPVVQLLPNGSVFNVTEGLMKFEFICNVIDANPMPQPDGYSWLHGGTVIQGQTRSSYELLNVQKSHDGVYQCMGRNNYGTGNSSTMYLNVQYGAEIINISVSEGDTVHENNTATIICIVDSNPESNITWTKQGIMGNLQTNLSVHESRLILENAGCLDTANYTCDARNGVGQPVEKTVPLYVTCHPRTDFRSPPVTKVYSYWHGNASLNYTVISFPEPRFNWAFIGNGSKNRSLPESAMKHDSGFQSVLMFNNLNIMDFGFYKVIAENMFPLSATEVFQLIPAGVPEVPSNVTVTDVKQTSLTVQWVAGYDGGLKQTFHIMITASDIMRSVYTPDPGYGKLGTQTIEDLIPNTEYSIFMSANNSLYSSNVTNAIIGITLKVPDTSLFSISAIAGGVSAGIVTIVLVGIGIIVWRRCQHNKSVDGLVDNPVYDLSDVNPGQLVEYASVDKSKKRTSQTEDLSNVYAQVDKTTKSGQNRAVKGKHGENSKGEIYENATLNGRSTNNEDTYENPGNSQAETCENVYENPGRATSNGAMMNKDGFLYADLTLIPPTTKNGKQVILGLKNRTVYAEIAYGKRGELLPDEEKEHGSSTNEPREK